MFGWEFPPHIAGGLGTACYGMTRGLAKNGVDVIFVMPKASGDEDQRFVKVVNASDVETTFGPVDGSEDIWDKLTFIQIDSNMVPYISPEELQGTRSELFVPLPADVPEGTYRLRVGSQCTTNPQPMKAVAYGDCGWTMEVIQKKGG